MPASAYIDALVSGYPREARAAKVLVMLQAFIDDSASEQGDRNLFLAGYIQRAPVWTAFSDDWQLVLASHPKIAHLHMVEAESLRGEFRGWSASQRDLKIQALAEVIERHGAVSIVCSISRNIFNSVLKPIAPYALSSPYFYCFYGIIITAARWALARNGNVPIDFIFDEHGALGTEASGWYEVIRQLQKPEIQQFLGSTPVFRDDKKFLPLQAADMLAWHLRRKNESRNATEDRPFSDRLQNVGDHIGVVITEDFLKSWAEQMSSVPGVADTRHKNTWRKMKAPLARMLSAPPDSPEFLPNYLRENASKFRFARIRLKVLGGLNKARRLRGIVRRFFRGRAR